MKHADLTPQDIDDLHSGLQCFVEGERIGEHIAIIEGQREYIQKLKDYESDFINLFKLYIKLWRLNLSDRVNYYGVLIEETANGTKDGQGKTMNEYTVTEVKKLEDIHYED